jgi:Tfp pilus assembly protein PilX
MRTTTTRLRHSERGSALVISLLLMMTLSMLGASFMFLAQTETASSISYRTMSQARYGAEAGVHKTINYLLNTYAKPGTVADPLANYNLNASPVTWNNLPVILSSNPAVGSNYPIAAVQTAFSNAVQGTLPAGSATVSYNASAKLMSMIQLSTYGGVTTVVQTWLITADGTVGGVHSANVQVTSTLEQQIVPAVSDAAFATGAGCGALTFGGNELINSYDSTAALASGQPVYSTSGGNVGTNGNMTLSGQATINGTLSTPRTGVGTCTNGNVDALTQGGQATVTGGLVQLPQTVVLDTPPPPSPMPPTSSTSFTKNTGCAGAGSCTFTTVSGKDIATLTGGTTPNTALTLGDVSVSTQGTLHLTGGAAAGSVRYYNFNSISVGSQSSIIIDGPGAVILNIAGTGQSTPIDFSGGSVTNSSTSFDPSLFQVVYGGTGNIKLVGGAATAMVVYAPNASANFPSSNANFYGSIIASTISSNGAQIHYDRHLASQFLASGNVMLTAFTWKKY